MLGDRIRILKPQPENQLHNLPDGAVVIFQVGISNRYAEWPASLEDICLADFEACYNLTSLSSNEHTDIESEEEEEEVTSSIMQLQKVLGTMYKRRRGAIFEYKDSSESSNQKSSSTLP